MEKEIDLDLDQEGAVQVQPEAGEFLSARQYQLFDTAVRFQSKTRRLVEIAEYLYGPNQITGKRGQEVVVEMSHTNDMYQLYVHGLPISFYKNEWELLLHFKARLIKFFWKEKTKPLLLHAGAIAKSGQGIVLVGDDGTGKTTLTLGLVNKGFNYLSDEYGIVDLETGKLRYHPAPVSLRPNSLVLERNLGGRREKVRDDLFEINVWDPEDHGVRKPLFPAPIYGEPADNIPLKYVIFLEPSFDNPPKLERDTNTQRAIADLRANTAWHAKWSSPPNENIERFLNDTISSSSIFRLSVGGLDDTISMIERLVLSS